MRDQFDYYYVTDSGELTCATCALESAQQMWEKDNSDASRRLRALIRLEQPQDIDALYQYAQDRFDEAIRYRHLGNPRDRAAWRLLCDTVSGIDDNGGASGWGENCGGCHTELVEPYVVCESCGHADYASNFDSAGNEWGDGGENPTVPYCGRCEDEQAQETITTDRRGYRLWFTEDYRGAGPIYGAGCRRFTLDQALAHWGSPTHPDRKAAEQLFAGVLQHAATRALTMIAKAEAR